MAGFYKGRGSLLRAGGEGNHARWKKLSKRSPL